MCLNTHVVCVFRGGKCAVWAPMRDCLEMCMCDGAGENIWQLRLYFHTETDWWVGL